MCADRVAGHINLLTEIALGRVGEEGGIGRIVECEHPAFQITLLCSKGSRFDSCLRQAVELLFVCDMECESLVLFQQVLRELQGEHGSLLC